MIVVLTFLLIILVTPNLWSKSFYYGLFITLFNHFIYEYYYNFNINIFYKYLQWKSSNQAVSGNLLEGFSVTSELVKTPLPVEHDNFLFYNKLSQVVL